jgi:hypothetical protein
MRRGAGGKLGALGRPNPYSRAEWAELQLQFRPPRDGPAVSTRLSDYATAEEIGGGVAALQLLRRELACGRGAPHVRRGGGCSPGRHVGRRGPAPNWLDPRVPAQGHRPPRLPRRCRLAAGGFRKGSYSRSSARYELARAVALGDLRRAWTPPPVDDAREGHLRWMALRDIRWCREWLLPHEKRLSTSKQYRLISER